jgi:hypothetical protein
VPGQGGPDDRRRQRLVVVGNTNDNWVFSSANFDLGGATRGAEPTREAALPSSFLLQATKDWILITSQDIIATINLVGARHNVMQVEPIGKQDALTLSRSKVQVDRSFEGNAQALVKTLEGIMLAVTHATAYIAVREPGSPSLHI